MDHHEGEHCCDADGEGDGDTEGHQHNEDRKQRDRCLPFHSLEFLFSISGVGDVGLGFRVEQFHHQSDAIKEHGDACHRDCPIDIAHRNTQGGGDLTGVKGLHHQLPAAIHHDDGGKDGDDDIDQNADIAQALALKPKADNVDGQMALLAQRVGGTHEGNPHEQEAGNLVGRGAWCAKDEAGHNLPHDTNDQYGENRNRQAAQDPVHKANSMFHARTPIKKRSARQGQARIDILGD